jgi:hypothetical protein
MRRASWEAVRARLDEGIERRRREGVPLDDETDWAKEVAFACNLEASIKAQDTAAYRDLLEAALVRTRGALSPIGPYVPDPKLAGIEVAFRTISRREYLQCMGDLEELRRRLDTIPLTRASMRYAVLADIEEAQTALVRLALVELRGLEIDGKDAFLAVEGTQLPSEETMGVLVASGLLEPLFGAARDFQALDPQGRMRFGLQPLPTSDSSSAVGAQGERASSAGATAAAPLGGTQAPSMRTAPVPVDAFSSTPGSTRPLPSGAPPMEARSVSAAMS